MRLSAFLPAVAVAAALACWAPRAHGAQPPRVRKIAVFDIKTVGTVDPKTVAGLSALLASEVSRHEVKVFAGADLAALLDFERQKALLGCGDDACLAQIGGGLGVDYLLTSEVSEVGGRWLLTAALLNVARAAAVARTTKKAASVGELVDLAPEVVAEVMGQLSGAQPKAPAPAPVPAAATQAAPASGSGQRVAGYALLGVAGAALVGGVIAGVLGYVENADARDRNPPTSTEALAAKRSSIDAKLWVADGLFIAAAAAAGTGLAVLLTAPSAPATAATPRTMIGLAPLDGGALVSVSGGF